MISFKDYQSRIDYLKKISDYHFDPFLKEERPFHVPGNFWGQAWFSEVLQLQQEALGGAEFGFSHCVDSSIKKRRPNIQFDLTLTGETSYDPRHIFLNRIRKPLLCREKTPILYKMIDWFAMEPESVDPRIHIQYPGQVFPIHVDGLAKHKTAPDLSKEAKAHPDRWARVQVQLCDWIWGHLWVVGNHYWSQWRAGDIMYFPWWKIPHATANCGYSPRYSLQITGIVTNLTRKRLRSENLRIDLNEL